jgi:toxin ParE1/3/4
MTSMKVIKTSQFMADVEDVVLFIAKDNLRAALELEQHLHSQVDRLADPNFPRRLGRVVGTLELVAHPNYIVLLQHSDTTVTVLNVLHVARKHP